MRNRLITTLSVVALSLGGIAACADVADDADEAELVEGSDDAKTDQANIALTSVDFDAPEDAHSVKVGVIKSKAAFKDVFGVAAPSSIHFDQYWVAYLSLIHISEPTR